MKLPQEYIDKFDLMSDERIAKLPKFAQREIKLLRMKLAENMDTRIKLQTNAESPIYYDDYSESISKRIYVQATAITIRDDRTRLSCQFRVRKDRPGIRLYWECEQDYTCGIFPSASNAVELLPTKDTWLFRQAHLRGDVKYEQE